MIIYAAATGEILPANQLAVPALPCHLSLRIISISLSIIRSQRSQTMTCCPLSKILSTAEKLPGVVSKRDEED